MGFEDDVYRAFREIGVSTRPPGTSGIVINDQPIQMIQWEYDEPGYGDIGSGSFSFRCTVPDSRIGPGGVSLSPEFSGLTVSSITGSWILNMTEGDSPFWVDGGSRWRKASELKPLWDHLQKVASTLLVTPIPPASETMTGKLAAALRELGIDASLADHPYWFIEIAEGPIRRIDVRFGVCEVPDSRIPNQDLSYFHIQSERVKSFPIFGRVTGVRWRLDRDMERIDDLRDDEEELPKDDPSRTDFGFGRRLTNHLNEASGLNEYLVLIDHDLTIAEAGGGLWHLRGFAFQEKATRNPMELARLRSQWDAYQAVAEALLAIPILDE